MNRLLSKIRNGRRNGAAYTNGVSHVRLVSGRPTTPRSRYVVTAAETAPCTCPEHCERDHDNE